MCFSDIKNEFISLLTYSIDDLQLEIPEPQLFEEKQIEKRERTWEERLKNIQPGKEFFKEYEKICTEILKNILGEYLGLWAVQEHSNEELYCFDLCCKIKNGVDQDFFNTIQNYFNTKYIVFEFKNYKEKITQREIYTTEKYLYKKALRSVAIIVSREGASRNALLAAKGCLRENGKLILCLSDKDLNELIHIKEKGRTANSRVFWSYVRWYTDTFGKVKIKSIEQISWGIFLEDNNIIDETGDYVTICSTQKMDKERYDDYKLLAMNYGKLEECIYEDGTFSILLTYSSYIKGQQLAAYIEQKDNVILAYG